MAGVGGLQGYLGCVWAMEFAGSGLLWGCWRATGGLVNFRERLQGVGPGGPSGTGPQEQCKAEGLGTRQEEALGPGGRGKGTTSGLSRDRQELSGRAAGGKAQSHHSQSHRKLWGPHTGNCRCECGLRRASPGAQLGWRLREQERSPCRASSATEASSWRWPSAQRPGQGTRASPVTHLGRGPSSTLARYTHLS